MISGQKLRAFRESRGMRPVDVASNMGVDRQRIGQIEKQPDVGAYVATRFIRGVLQRIGNEDPIVEIVSVVMVDGQEFMRFYP